MFGKRSYKKIIIGVLALTMILGTVALAAEGIHNKELTATYGRIKFSYEGKDVTDQIEEKYGTPAFTVNSRAYVPIRSIADLLGVDIEYDHQTHMAKITGGNGGDYKKRLDEKDEEIAKLKKELAELKKEDKKVEVTKSDLKDLQKTLNDKYYEYREVDFDILLSESGNEITIKINTDLKNIRDEQNWIRMSTSDKRYLIQDIVSRVRKEFPKSDVTGSIYDSASRKDLYTFRQTKSGNLGTTNKDYIGDRGLDRDANDYLDDYVYKEFKRLHGIESARLYKGGYDSYEIYFPETRGNEDALRDMRRSDMKDLLEDVAREIRYESDYRHGYDDIIIYVEMGSEDIAKYDHYTGELEYFRR